MMGERRGGPRFRGDGGKMAGSGVPPSRPVAGRRGGALLSSHDKDKPEGSEGAGAEANRRLWGGAWGVSAAEGIR